MPLAVKKLLQRDDIDGLVVLGAVIEGSTEHDEIVAQHAARKIADLALDYEKPIGLGITGPGMSRMEAHERVSYAKRAVEAAVKMIKTIRGMDGSSGGEGAEAAYDSGGRQASSGGTDPLGGLFDGLGGRIKEWMTMSGCGKQ